MEYSHQAHQASQGAFEKSLQHSGNK
jgi:hypothetical protein